MIAHKKKHGSCLKDPENLPNSTAYCGEVVDDRETFYFWKNVDCKKCLHLKNVDAGQREYLRKTNERI